MIENGMVIDRPKYFQTKRRSIFVCEICNEVICEGERYYDIEGMIGHKECIEEEYLQIAEEEVD